MVQVLAIDIGDHRDDGRELEERAVALVGLRYQEIAVAHPGVRAAHGAHAAADHHRRVEASVVQDGGGHRRGGGLAVAARHRNAVLQPHQLGQHLAARDDRDLQTARLLHLGVRFVDRGADNEGAGAGEIGGAVAFEHTGAHRGKPLGNGRKLHIRPADLVTEVEQHFGNAAHSDPAYARKMKMLGAKKHFLNVLFRLAGPVSTEFLG